MELEAHQGPTAEVEPGGFQAPGGQMKSKICKVSSTLIFLVVHGFICSLLPIYVSSIYKLLALCNFIWLQPQRRTENLILELSGEYGLLSSGVSAPSAWG